jgi:hypothetical protein
MSMINFSQEALESLSKFSSSIEQPMIIAGTFQHDQDFIKWLVDSGKAKIEITLKSFECSEVATPKIKRTPFTSGTGENVRVDYINNASVSSLQMNGIAVLDVTGYDKSVKVRMSVATLAAIAGKENPSLNTTVGEITVGRRAGKEKWLSVNSDNVPNFAELQKLAASNAATAKLWKNYKF